jgi:hypothetical protein
MELLSQFRQLIHLVLAMAVLVSVLFCRRSDDEENTQKMLNDSVPNQISQQAESLQGGEAKVLVSVKKAVAVRRDSSSDLISVDFPELTNVNDIVKFYQLVTGRQVRIDPKLALKVKIDSDQLLPKEEALEFLLSSLKHQGVRIVEKDGITYFSAL